MRVLKQGTTANMMLLLVSNTDHVTGVDGAGPGLNISISKNGGTFAAITPTVSGLGSGWYSVSLTTAHTDTIGDLAVHAYVTVGADPTDRLCVVESRDFTGLASDISAVLSAIPTAATIAVAVWSAGARTITSFGTLAADAATAVWGAATRTLSAFGFGVTANSVTDKTGYSLAATQTCNITGNLSGSVGSVTGTVGSVTGSVGSVTGNVAGVVAGVSSPVTLTALYDAAKTTAPTTAQIDAALTVSHGSGSWQTGGGGGGGSGSGDTPIDHNFRGADALRYLTATGIPVDNGAIVAYLKSSYDAGNLSAPVGSTMTRSDGRWQNPLLLDHGVTYTLLYYKQGVYQGTTVEVTP